VLQDLQTNQSKEKKDMLSKKGLVATTALVFLGFLGASTAKADDTQCYTVASLKGTYAVVGTYGANVALALATRHFDGKGNLTGTFILNEPDPASSTGGRKIVTGTQVGTYTINCDGTGVFTRVLTASNGVTTTQLDDFLITKAKANEKDGQLIATALEDAQRTPSAIVAGGIFLIRSYTRRPDGDTGKD
jgi:hypothetical protein